MEHRAHRAHSKTITLLLYTEPIIKRTGGAQERRRHRGRARIRRSKAHSTEGTETAKINSVYIIILFDVDDSAREETETEEQREIMNKL